MVCLLSLALLLPATELTEPYRVKIVISVARHKLLTDVFKQQIEREIGDGLQSALGKLARVRVTDKHDLLPNIRSQGLDRVLASHRARTPEQTHFVLIDFDGKQYDIRTRAHDGLTGLPAAATRTGFTRDRAFVGRLAVLLIERDLGINGTIVDEPDAGGQVRVRLRGGELGEVGRWVRKGEIFTVINVPPAGVGVLQPSLYLQVMTPPEQGVCVCRVLRRFRIGSIAGMTASLLTTRTGPLRLRLVQETPAGTRPFPSSVRLVFRRYGFEGEEGALAITATGRKDVDTARYKAQGEFEKIVFVSVMSGETTLARIPVPVVDESVTVLNIPAVNEEESGAIDRYRTLVRSVLEAGQVQSSMFEDINRLVRDPDKRSDAIRRTKETLNRLREDHVRLRQERDAVEKELAKIPAASRPDLTPISNRLNQIAAGEKDLLAHVANLERIEAEENDPKRKEWLVNKAEALALVKKAEVAKAIALLEAGDAMYKSAEDQKLIAELKAKWKPKDATHAAARTFIYSTFGGLTLRTLKDRLGEAETALNSVITAGDEYSPVKFREVALEHVRKLDAELKTLNPEVNGDDEEVALAIREMFPKLRRLIELAESATKGE
jgi:hypothetical protein